MGQASERIQRAALSWALLATSLFVVAQTGLSDDPVSPDTISDESLLQLARTQTNLLRVTSKPITLSPNIARLCVPPGHSQLMKKDGAFIHVFVTPGGSNAMKVASAPFPIGTIILKQKFARETPDQPELYTGMIKRTTGYNPAAGDWEFFTLSGDAKAVTSRGRIDSCINCHSRYSQTDFVTRRY